MSSISSASSSTTVSTPVEVERPALHVVDRAPWRCHYDVDSALQLTQLSVDGLAAVDRQHPGIAPTAVPVQRLRNLDAELAGWHQHQRDRAVTALAVAQSIAASGSANAAVLPVPVAA